MRARKNWPLFFTLVSMGLSINAASDLMGLHPNSVYQHAQRKPKFRQQLNEAIERGSRCIGIAPAHFIHPVTFEPILSADLDLIPRKPPHGLRFWVLEQMTHHPFNTLAA